MSRRCAHSEIKHRTPRWLKMKGALRCVYLIVSLWGWNAGQKHREGDSGADQQVFLGASVD
eukprot:629659-Rhodomonas_salina.2